MEYKDYLDRDIQVDDSVIFILPHNGGLQLGRVVKLTPKNIRVAYRIPYGWNKGDEYTAVRLCKDVVKIDGPELTSFLLKQ